MTPSSQFLNGYHLHIRRARRRTFSLSVTLPTLMLCLAMLHSMSSPYLSQGAPPFVWIGAVTSSSLIVHTDVPKRAKEVILSDSASLSRVLQRRSPDAGEAVAGDVRIYGRLRRFTFSDLSASTRYYIGYTTPDGLSVSLASTRTFPDEGAPSDVVLAFSSCQLRTSWDDAFRDMRERRKAYNDSTPFVFLHMGDLAYSDISENDVTQFESATRAVVTSPGVHAFFNSTPVVYMFDDHDYGSNNADGKSLSKEAALQNYLTMIPRYITTTIPISNSSTTQQQQKLPSVPQSDTTYHAFTVGRVRIVVTDLRSQSDRGTGTTTLGETQLQWLLSEFSQARNYSLVVWLSTKPWIGAEKPGSDSWNGFSSERARIANFLLKQNVTNLVMTSGDAHMLAADNGTHSAYHSKDSSVGGFPVFQAAPLGHFGNAKGGPYSHGCRGFRFYPNSHYGFLAIKDPGNGTDDSQVCVQFSGFRAHRKKALISFTRCGTMRAPQRSSEIETTGSCKLVWVPAWVWVVFTFTVLWFVASCVGLVVCIRNVKMRRKAARADEMSATASVTLSTRSEVSS